MFGRVLASFGLGSAKVDTRLKKAVYRQGEMVQGDIFIQGGKTEQTIDSIYMYLILQNHSEPQLGKYILDKIHLTDPFTIGAHETKVIPFQFQLPFDTPVTAGGSVIYLKTGLDIKTAIDPDDRDGFEVLPSLLVDKILKVTEEIGFQLHNIEFDYEMFHARHPFVQKFKLMPLGEYVPLIDDIKFIFYPSPDEVDIIIQVNNRARDLKSSVEETLQMDERVVRFTVTHEETNLFQLITDHIQNCISE